VLITTNPLPVGDSFPLSNYHNGKKVPNEKQSLAITYPPQSASGSAREFRADGIPACPLFLKSPPNASRQSGRNAPKTSGMKEAADSGGIRACGICGSVGRYAFMWHAPQLGGSVRPVDRVANKNDADATLL
jgi:hypothetical protein